MGEGWEWLMSTAFESYTFMKRSVENPSKIGLG